MTNEQFERMKEFATRMVPVAIGSNRWRKVLAGHVEEVLARIDCENFGIHWRHIVDWDNKTKLPDDDGTCGFACSDDRYLLCDFMSVYCWDNDLEREKEDRQGNCEVVETKVGTALRCCIRAACDVAVAPSAGVLGFTVGDLRQMWPEGIPAWVNKFFITPLHHARNTTPVWL